jgi:hypothetical protein
MAGNITSDNVGPLHLINVKRLAYVVRTVEEAFPSQAGASQPLAAQPLARSAGASAAPAVSKQTVISAVERYLAGRGINLQPAENSPSPASAQTVRSSVIPEVSAQVVDRFLSSRKAASNPASDSGGCPSCVAASPPAEAPQPPAPAVRIVDFVAEADVRTAIEQSKKIFIGPKTIVTPAARELADRHDTLVLAQRP